jgi:hypothetical protein
MGILSIGTGLATRALLIIRVAMVQGKVKGNRIANIRDFRFAGYATEGAGVSIL